MPVGLCAMGLETHYPQFAFEFVETFCMQWFLELAG
jgi:hypothetical protein